MISFALIVRCWFSKIVQQKPVNEKLICSSIFNFKIVIFQLRKICFWVRFQLYFHGFFPNIFIHPCTPSFLYFNFVKFAKASALASSQRISMTLPGVMINLSNVELSKDGLKSGVLCMLCQSQVSGKALLGNGMCETYIKNPKTQANPALINFNFL